MPVLSLDPSSTALLVVDLQRGVVSRDVGPHPADTVVENALQLCEAFRSAGAPVVLVRRTPDDGARPPVDADAGRQGPGPALGEVVGELLPLGDVALVRSAWSAFHGTALDAELRARSVATVVLAGLTTDGAVESTARAAHDHGYGVVVPEDACSGTDAVVHEFAVARTFPQLARVTTTAATIAALG